MPVVIKILITARLKKTPAYIMKLFTDFPYYVCNKGGRTSVTLTV